MKLKFEYGSGVITLPASVIAKSERTTKKDIRLLFLIASIVEFWYTGDV